MELGLWDFGALPHSGLLAGAFTENPKVVAQRFLCCWGPAAPLQGGFELWTIPVLLLSLPKVWIVVRVSGASL